jgi:hypothetical protein
MPGSILDPKFPYVPSTDTNIRETFARARGVTTAAPQPGATHMAAEKRPYTVINLKDPKAPKRIVIAQNPVQVRHHLANDLWTIEPTSSMEMGVLLLQEKILPETAGEMPAEPDPATSTLSSEPVSDAAGPKSEAVARASRNAR